MGIKITVTKKNITINPSINTTITLTKEPPKTITINNNPVFVKGDPGLSNYELALKNNLITPDVSEVEWLESLKGKVFWSSTNW